MTDLTTWLLEQIEADEVVARAATEGPWEAATGASGSESWVERRNLADIAYVQGNPNHAADAAHIATQDPAAALRRCAALREAIEDAWGDHERIEGEWGMCRSRERMEADGDCPDVVTSLAAMFSGRAGYAEAVGL